MGSNTLIEVFGHIVFSFTRGVTEHYNPEEPEFTEECYDPLESTGREWYYHPVDELIYQEYSDREATNLDYLASSRLNVRVVNASSPDENEETQEDQQSEDRAMEWKRLRPSALRTVCSSMYIGALISLLTATLIGTVYVLVSYLCYNTTLICRFTPMRSFPVREQWARAISDLCASAIYFAFSCGNLLLLFRPYQVKGVKRKLVLLCCLVYCLNGIYRVVLQALGTPYYTRDYYRVPLYALFIINISLQLYSLAKHFSMRSRKEVTILIGKMTVPTCVTFMIAFVITRFIYPAYNKQARKGKLLIAIFAPLIGVVLKVFSRIGVQRLWNITHPGYSYAILAPLYFGAAVMFRVMQVDLDRLQSIAILGIIHGAAEVIERSTMVVVDHICHRLWKRTSAPWGSFRTLRSERLMADIAIMSMLYESTAIVSVNGLLCLYQFIYLENNSFLNLLKNFAIHTSVPLVIEWFFTSVSLAIETRYQNMAVMAVWRRRWKRHILVAIVNAIPVAIWTSTNLLEILQGRFNEHPKHPCKMPFS